MTTNLEKSLLLLILVLFLITFALAFRVNVLEGKLNDGVKLSEQNKGNILELVKAFNLLNKSSQEGMKKISDYVSNFEKWTKEVLEKRIIPEREHIRELEERLRSNPELVPGHKH